MKKTRTLFFLLAGIFLLSMSACVDPVVQWIPAVPANLLVYADSGTVVELAWNGDNLADGYTVYRSTGPYSKFESIASTSQTHYRDERCVRDTAYYYKVSANSSASSSAPSSVAGCRTPGAGDKSFWSVDLAGSSERPYKTWAELRKTGTECEVYCEISGYTGNTPTITDAHINELIIEFDLMIYNKLTPVYGNPQGIGSNKITLLLLDIKDGYSGSDDGYVAGFFHPKDMFETELYSNKRPMLYIDIYPGGFDGYVKEQLFNTVAHEFQHLINDSKHPGKEMDLWINEGLSEAASYVYHGDIDDSRIGYYRQDPTDSIVSGNTFYVWYDAWNDALAEYSTVYLFFQWLRIHSAGTTIYSDIINSGHSDYRAVEAAVKKNIKPSMNWEEILRAWLAANFLCDESSLFGYKTEITNLALGYISNQYNLLQMAPGEGVFSKIDTPFLTPPPSQSLYGGFAIGGNIRYAGIEYTPGGTNNDVELSAPFDSNYMLTYNANTKSEITADSDWEIGYVAGVQQPMGSGRFVGGGVQAYSVAGYEQDEASPADSPLPYEWDSARYFFEKANPVPRPSRPVMPWQ